MIVVIVFTVIYPLSLPFFTTPGLKKSGELIYYSSLFITEKPKNNIINIHTGTLFDYLFVIDRKMTGNQRTKFVIQNYLQGLLTLIEKYEKADNANLRISGTSYIINERTANKIGFRIVKNDSIQIMFFVYIYLNLLISNSIAKNKVSFPNLLKTKTFETDLNQLIKRKKYITELNNKLKRTIANNVYET
jgi:hypothetical protein